MIPALHRSALAVLAAFLMAASPVAADPPARDLFGAVHAPTAPFRSGEHAVGSYARGCLAGAVQLAADGPGWQAMRLSRDRHWGHPALVAYIEALAAAARADGWPGLLVGDMGGARGGPMPSGHASHQIGLDVDLWLDPAPGRTLSPAERESLSARSVLKAGSRTADPKKLTEGKRMLIYRAATLPGVARIFVAPGIKKVMCAINWRDRSFLSKLRPWYGHDDHIHVRLACPPGEALCVDQAAPPPGDGCGADLDWWFTDEPYRPGTSAPGKPLTLADLPRQCAAVIGG